MTGNDSKKAQTLIRKYLMERFLARIARFEYKNNFILKGGMLVSAFVGIEARTTMDIDTIVRMLPLTKDKAVEVITAIKKVNLDDGISYKIKKVKDIMEEHDYSGVRFTVAATLDMWAICRGIRYWELFYSFLRMKSER